LLHSTAALNYAFGWAM